MSERIERVFSAVLVAAALVIAATAVHREFFPTANGGRGTPSDETTPTFTAAWQQALPIGEVFGDTNSLMKVVVLSDLECPYCRRFHTEMKEVLKMHRQDVEMVFVHFPLGMH